MKKRILFCILWAAKWSGIFWICRQITRRDVRILCYHGGELRDESEFRPNLFIDGETFSRRMQYLARNRYAVTSLEEALARPKRGAPANCATVITIDDGWYGTYKVLGPILREHGFPATLYVASYYLDRQTQVFNVALSYIFWRSPAYRLDLQHISSALSGVYDLSSEVERDEAVGRINCVAEHLHGAEARQAMLRKICELLHFNWRQMEVERLLSYMTKQEAKDLLDQGVDLQLHTHRHKFGGLSPDEMRKEIADNRTSLRDISDAELCHFCFPSGEFDAAQLSHLSALGIKSATTVKRGFVRPRHSRFELPRFLDSATIMDLEFEAEMTGFFEIVRRCGYSI